MDTLAQHISTYSNGAGPPHAVHSDFTLPPAREVSHADALVTYDLPSFYSAVAHDRLSRTMYSSIDENSDAFQSDLQFAHLKCSKAEDSIIHHTRLTACLVRNSTIQQSKIENSFICADCDIKDSSVTNSTIFEGTKLWNCTVVNSQISGGEHIGQFLKNVRIPGSRLPEAEDALGLSSDAIGPDDTENADDFRDG